MSRFLAWIKRTPILVPLFFLLFLYLPSALLLPPEVDRNAIITAVGIDKDNEEYSLSFLRYVPQANADYSEKLEVVTTTGKSISQNLEKASVIMGKNINLNHAESIVLGNSMLEEDVSIILDFFVRAPIVLNGCLLCASNVSAKETIETINALNDSSKIKLEDILRYAEVNFYGRETTLETFFGAPLNLPLCPHQVLRGKSPLQHPTYFIFFHLEHIIHYITGTSVFLQQLHRNLRFVKELPPHSTP